MFSLLELFFSCCIIVAVAKKTYWKRRPLSRLIGAVLDINYVKLPFEKDLVRSGGVLFAIVYLTGHVWFGVRVYGGGRGWRKSEKMPARRGAWRTSVEIASFSSDFNGARQIKFRETLKWKCKCKWTFNFLISISKLTPYFCCRHIITSVPLFYTDLSIFNSK